MFTNDKRVTALYNGSVINFDRMFPTKLSQHTRTNVGHCPVAAIKYSISNKETNPP